MTNTGFHYRAAVEWAGGRRTILRFPDLPGVEVAPPPEFGGLGESWTPEGLYVGAVASCFLLTFIALAERSDFELASADVSAEGKLEKTAAGGYWLSQMTLRPMVVVESAKDVERAERLLNKAEQSCFVAASIKSRVTVVAQVYHKQIPVSPCPAV
jgi:peroxiredoxin-like protein